MTAPPPEAPVKPVVPVPAAWMLGLLVAGAGCGPADDTAPILADVRGAPIDSPALSARSAQGSLDGSALAGTDVDEVAGAPLAAAPAEAEGSDPAKSSSWYRADLTGSASILFIGHGRSTVRWSGLPQSL